MTPDVTPEIANPEDVTPTEIEHEQPEIDEATPEIPEEEPEEKDPAERTLDEIPLPGEEDDEDEINEDGTKKKTKALPKWAEVRIARKERENAEIRERAERAEALLKQQGQPGAAPVPAGNNLNMGLPERTDFNSEGEYITALVRHENQQSFKRFQAEQERQAHFEAQQKFANDWNSSEEEGLKKYKNFDQNFARLNDKTFPSNIMMAQAIVASPYKVDIQEFLGSNIDFAKKIALKSPLEAAKEIHKIESRFEARKKAKLTKAPALITPVKSNKGAAAPVDPEKMSPDEYKTWYDDKYNR